MSRVSGLHSIDASTGSGSCLVRGEELREQGHFWSSSSFTSGRIWLRVSYWRGTKALGREGGGWGWTTVFVVWLGEHPD